MRHICSSGLNFRGALQNGLGLLAILLLAAGPDNSNAQMAPIQLTNPSIDAVNGDETAAWIADENLGVLYCELKNQKDNKPKRVACFDSNGAVAPAGNGRVSNR